MNSEEIFETYEIVCDRIKAGRGDNDFCLYGDIRKSVNILKELENIASNDENIHLIYVDETFTEDDAAALLAEQITDIFGDEVLEEVGKFYETSAKYDIHAIEDIILAAGKHLSETGQMLHISANRPDKLSRSVFSYLLGAKHRCNQEMLPVFLACAGGKKLLRIAGDLKGYAERMFYVWGIDYGGRHGFSPA